MTIGRWFAVLLCLCPLAPAMVQAQTNGADIVVSAGTEKKSDWKRAEADHVVVFSDGSEAELKRVTNNLERLYQLMSRIYRRGAQSDDTVKLQVTLFDSANFFNTMGLRNLRSEEGPFGAHFSNQRYYDPRQDGEVLALARADQTVDLDTNRANNLDCDDKLEQGADCDNLPYHMPVVRTWEAVLYSAFAQHFVLTYTQAVYPRWYLDGIGALFSTIDVRKNGSIDYARTPPGYTQFFRSYGTLNVADVLSGHYLDPASNTLWTPYHAWLIAHYFLYSNLSRERSREFAQYMTAIHQGTPMAEAAKIFGDMRRLQHEIVVYARNNPSFGRTDPIPVLEGDPLITTLPVSSAALIETKIEMETRLNVRSGSQAPSANWVAQVRNRVAQLSYDPEVVLVVAEAECRSGHHAECLAAAEQVLAQSPDNVRALAWKGVALTDQAIAGPAADRAATLATARQIIQRASQLDSQAPLPLIAYFQSFTKAGEQVPEQAMLGMARVIQYVPAAPTPRLDLGEELVRQGKADLARGILYPVLYGPDDSPEKGAAQALFRPVGSGPQGVSQRGR